MQQCKGKLNEKQFKQQVWAGSQYVPVSFRGRGMMFMILLTFAHDPPGVIYLGDGAYLVHIRTMLEVLEFRVKADTETERRRIEKREFMLMIRHLHEISMIMEYHTGQDGGITADVDFLTVVLRPIVDNFGDHKIPAEDFAKLKLFKFKELFMKGSKHGLAIAKEKAREIQDRTLPQLWNDGALTGFEFNNFGNADELLKHWKRYKRLPITELEREVHKQLTYERNWQKRIDAANRPSGPRRSGSARKKAQGGTSAGKKSARTREHVPANKGDEFGAS